MTLQVRILSSSLALLAAAFAGLGHAAPTEVGVTGRIKPPAPICTVQMPQEVQYGVIAHDKINANGVTVLDKKGFSVRIDCDQSARFAVQFVDLKQATAVDDAAFLAAVAQALPDVGKDHAYGLGLDSVGHKIGAMFLKFDDAAYTASVTAGPASSAVPFYQDGESWMLDKTQRMRQQIKYTFAPPSYVAPIKIGTLHMDVGLVPVIDSGKLDLTKEIDVSGRITLEISQI